MISLEAFATFSLWWAPLMRTLSLIRHDWEATDPIRVHGFVERFWAAQALKERDSGTFLLRFSETVPGALVSSCRQHVSVPFWVGPKRVAHYLLEVKKEGCCFFTGPRRYLSLRDLVMETSALSMLYPDTPKE
ncbi:unnamed protein product, partial [Scytosiphon promiscuus]